VRIRVENARLIQKKRFQGASFHTNSEINVRSMKRFCELSAACERLLERAVDTYHLSPRVCHHLQKVALTISDLAESPSITPEHIAEAIQYRPFERGERGNL